MSVCFIANGNCSCPDLPSLLFYKHWACIHSRQQRWFNVCHPRRQAHNAHTDSCYKLVIDSPMTNLLQGSVCFLDRYRLAVQNADALSCSNSSASAI